MTGHIHPKNTLDTLRQYMLVDGYPIVFDLEKSRGAFFHNAADGNDYLDCFAFIASLPIGYNHPKLSDPTYQKKLCRAAQVKIANPDIYTVELAEFVDTFARIAGRPPFKHYFFVEGGALAVENALKTAFDWKIRKNLAAGRGEIGTKIIYFKDAFHGRSGYTLTMTNTFDPNKTKYFPKFDWIKIDNPFIHEKKSASTMQLEEAAALKQIETALAKHGHDVAALIIEPIQSEGGDHHFRKEFFGKLRELCDKNEILLIFDEVQTGIGLTGKMWAYEHTGITPDIIAFGKKVQCGGIMCTTRIDDVDNVFKVSSRINSTWGGSLVDMVRSTQYLKIIQEEHLVENASAVGSFFQEKLKALSKEFPIVSNVRGQGLLIAFNLPDTKTRDLFIENLWNTRCLVLTSGASGVRLRPVLDFSKQNVEEALLRIKSALKGLP